MYGALRDILKSFLLHIICGSAKSLPKDVGKAEVCSANLSKSSKALADIVDIDIFLEIFINGVMYMDIFNTR